MTGTRAGVPPVFRPGEHAQISGLYQVLHCSHDRGDQVGVIVRGQVFPDCKQCGDEVRYLLLRSVPYIFDDDDFADDSAGVR